MQAEDKDSHDLKQMQGCINETIQTLVLCKPRIDSSMDDLENVMATYEEKPGEMFDLLKQTEEWNRAQSVFAEAKAFVDAIEM